MRRLHKSVRADGFILDVFEKRNLEGYTTGWEVVTYDQPTEARLSSMPFMLRPNNDTISKLIQSHKETQGRA